MIKIEVVRMEISACDTYDNQCLRISNLRNDIEFEIVDKSVEPENVNGRIFISRDDFDKMTTLFEEQQCHGY